jgi:hypothetical protein
VSKPSNLEGVEVESRDWAAVLFLSHYEGVLLWSMFEKFLSSAPTTKTNKLEHLSPESLSSILLK